MLKALVNEAHLCLDITTSGPLLVKTGYATVIGADMAPVETYRNGHKEIYLPGSSLKGIFRSHIEKVINSIQPRVACNPFQGARDPLDNLYSPFCGSRFDAKTPSHQVYAESCPTCRLFGSTQFAGRLAVQDAYLNDDKTYPLIEHRDGVGIDRLTGGAKPGAKFDMETVTANTTFSTMLHLRNFEIWQLGLLLVIIKDMEDELIRIGSGRSRGLGRVTVKISEREEGSHPGGLVLRTIRTGKESREPKDQVWGLGHWLGDESTLYGTKHDDLIELSPSIPPTQISTRYRRVIKGTQLNTFQEDCIEKFILCMQEWDSKQTALPVPQQRG